jgi:hypothetical protein
MPVAQTVESWAKIQVQELRDRHPKIRVAMGIDGQALQARDRLTHGAFDGSPSLPGRQEQRLIVDDTPLIENVGVGLGRYPELVRSCSPKIGPLFE